VSFWRRPSARSVRRCARGRASSRNVPASATSGRPSVLDRSLAYLVGWADALAIVKPATVVGWHRRGFARFWAYKSRRTGRPPLGREVIELIDRMITENPLWSRRRIAAELVKLGHDVNKDTVARYMPKRPRRPGRPPSTTCGTFLRMHLTGTLVVDFLTVPTVTFDVLSVFFILSLERRRILHVRTTWFKLGRCETEGPPGHVTAIALVRLAVLALGMYLTATRGGHALEEAAAWLVAVHEAAPRALPP
jgi:hypothetical protein